MTALNMDGSIYPISQAITGKPGVPKTTWGRAFGENVVFIGDFSDEIAEMVEAIKKVFEVSRRIPFYDNNVVRHDFSIGGTKIELFQDELYIFSASIPLEDSYCAEGWPGKGILHELKMKKPIEGRYIRLRERLIEALETNEKITARINRPEIASEMLKIRDDRALQTFRGVFRDEPRFINREPKYHKDSTPGAWSVTGATDGLNVDFPQGGNVFDESGDEPDYESSTNVRAEPDELGVARGDLEFHSSPYRHGSVHRTSFLSVLTPIAVLGGR